MKIKSMIAALAAGAIAMSAMALSASAEVLKKVGNEKKAEIYQIPVDGLDLSKLDKIVAEVSCTTNKLNGCFGYNNTSSEWVQVEFESVIDSGAISEKWEKDGLAGTVKDGLQVQLWWVQPVYEGETVTGDGTGQVDSIKLLDKDGNELTKSEETTTAAVTTTEKSGAAVTTTTTAKSTAKTDSTKTGDAGVGVVVAALGLASAAAFAARKKH